ncbi:MAG: energy-coupling factor transporter ATPase [Oscillospiraceae bacterium]|nr:energy-coupling factor transporter ATPase [Oscillospiraceae bacterium]
MNPIIDIQNLTFSYYSEEGVAPIVLDDLSLRVEEGSFVAVLGQNGSGKSTLAKHLNAILLPNRGTVTVDGIDTSDEDRLLDLRRTVGMVFQNPDNQIVASVVEEDVAFAPENMGLPPAEIRERVDRALELVHMTEYAHHAPHLLSGGQKQRVAIAGVIAMRPKVLVLDEATAMLDPEGRKDVMDIVKDLNQRVGVTVILITHHMEEAAEADRVLVLSDGQIAADGPPRQVFQQVEKLRSLGLSSPEPMELMWELRQAGLDVPLDVLTDDECVQALQALLAGSR